MREPGRKPFSRSLSCCRRRNSTISTSASVSGSTCVVQQPSISKRVWGKITLLPPHAKRVCGFSVGSPASAVQKGEEILTLSASRLSLLSQSSGHPAVQHHLTAHSENLRAGPHAGESNECLGRESGSTLNRDAACLACFFSSVWWVRPLNSGWWQSRCFIWTRVFIRRRTMSRITGRDGGDLLPTVTKQRYKPAFTSVVVSVALALWLKLAWAGVHNKEQLSLLLWQLGRGNMTKISHLTITHLISRYDIYHDITIISRYNTFCH